MSRASADDQLREAVSRLLVENELDKGVMTELGVIAVQQYFDDDGVAHTTIASLWPDAPPHYRRLGLLEYEAARLRRIIEDAPEEDEL